MAAGRPITKMFLALHGTSNIGRRCQEGPDQPRSEIMRALASLVLLALVATPVFAQNAQPNQQQPGGPNSGVGIAGQPGSKSGPAVGSPNSTTGAGVNSDGRSSEPRGNQDAAKVPGLPGGKRWPSGQVTVQPSIEIAEATVAGHSGFDPWLRIPVWVALTRGGSLITLPYRAPSPRASARPRHVPVQN